MLVTLCLHTAALAERQITLTFLGDTTLGGEERMLNDEDGFAKTAAREGYAYFFAKVKPLLATDDLTLANFEGVLKEKTGGQVNKTYCFRGLPAYAQILTLGSVEGVSIANNHTGDYGVKGYASTREALLSVGVQAVDLKNPGIIEIRGIKIGVLGIYAAGYFAKRNIIRDAVREVREMGADAVVCMVHAGQEYHGLHSRNQTLIARLLIDSGADVVVGTHPHVLQGLEVYNQRSILYSLGNFVFGGNAAVRSLETALARVTLTFDDSGAYLGQQLRLYPANVSGDAVRNNYQPVPVTGDAANEVWAQIDRDSDGQPGPVTQTETYRDYAYLPAAQGQTAP